MLRSSLFTASAIALMAGASAQNSSQNSPQLITDNAQGAATQKMLSTPKHAGIYHVSTGTWTRTGGAVANFGPDTIYSNTAISGYFTTVGTTGQLLDSENFDEGQIPSSNNTNQPGANRDEYNVNCIEIGYCDATPAAQVSGFELAFYSNYIPCTFDDTADVRFDTGPLPSNNLCWFVTLDLTGAEFCLQGDSDGVFDNDLDLDSFGWSFVYTGQPGSSGAGFFLTGDPVNTDPNFIPGGLPEDATNTYFSTTASLCSADEATGYNTQDFWFVEDPTAVSSGCFFFGGYNNLGSACGGNLNGPFTSYYMEIQASVGPCSSPISMPSGCNSEPNSTGVNSQMVVTGSTSIAANDVTLTATLPTNSFGFFITSQVIGGGAMPGGSSGRICVGANLGRFSQLITTSGAAGTIEISTTAGQFSLNALPSANPSSYAAAPGGSIHFQLWHRDVSTNPGGTSNLTDGVTLQWTP